MSLGRKVSVYEKNFVKITIIEKKDRQWKYKDLLKEYNDKTITSQNLEAKPDEKVKVKNEKVIPEYY